MKIKIPLLIIFFSLSFVLILTLEEENDGEIVRNPEDKPSDLKGNKTKTIIQEEIKPIQDKIEKNTEKVNEKVDNISKFPLKPNKKL